MLPNRGKNKYCHKNLWGPWLTPTTASRRSYRRATRKITVVQNNLHQNRVASALLCRKLFGDNIEVAPIQEPWLLGGGEIRGLTIRCKGGSIISPNCDNPRTCIYCMQRKDYFKSKSEVLFQEVSGVVGGSRR